MSAFIISLRFFALDSIYDLKSQKTDPNLHPVFVTLFMFLGESLCFIFILTPLNNLMELTSKNDSRISFVIHNNTISHAKTQNQKIKVILLIFTCSFLDLLFWVGSNFVLCFNKTEMTYFYDIDIKILQVWYWIIFTVILFKIKFYRHQWWAISIILWGVFLFFMNIVINQTFNIVTILEFVLLYAVWGLQIALEKYIMDIKYVSPYYLLFYEGITGWIMTLLVILFFYFKRELNKAIFSEENLDIEQSLNFTVEKLWLSFPGYLYLLLYLIETLGFNLLKWFTNYYLGPTLCSLIHTLSSIFYRIETAILMVLINFEYSWKITSFVIIGYITVIIGIMIYHEFIIIKVCGLETNTKIEILKREDNESLINSMLPLRSSDWSRNNDQ